MGRVLLTVFLASGLAFFGAWYFNLVPSIPGPGGTEVVPPVDGNKKPDLGGPLYPARAVAPIVARPIASRGDALLFSGQLVSRETIELATQADGQIAFIGEELPDWTPCVTGVAPLMAEPMQFVRVTMARLEQKEAGMGEAQDSVKVELVEQEVAKFYRRLKESDRVREDQMLALIDPTLTLSEVERQRAKVQIAEEDAQAAKATSVEADQRLLIAQDLWKRKAINAEDYRLARLTAVKSASEWQAKKTGIRLALTEEHQAKLKLKLHTVRNKLTGPYGVIKKILRQTGDSVKSQEPILQLVGVDPLEAEALVEVQLARLLYPKKRVIIEPTEEISPPFTFRAHTLEVTGVAVSNDPKSPLIVSGSEDRTVCVWVPGYQSPIGVLPHPAPVRSVVCSPAGAPHNLCLVGCDDGSLHLWSMAPDKSGLFTLIHTVSGDDAHKDSSVTALAFSPDGRWFASGGTDSRILVWDTDAIAKQGKEFQYAVESETGDNPHEGTITALTFLPQAKLVSAGRDKSLRVWTLHEKGARPAYAPLADRSGLVTQLGASQDGRWMLFDQAKSLQLRSAETGRHVSTLQNPAGAVPFETVAVFSPDASLLLTAGAAEGRLQLWKAPTDGGRGFEVRQLTTVERQPVTCAVFSPFAAPGGAASFAVSGTKDGNVYFWVLPSTREIDNHRIENAEVSVVSPVLDAGARQVPIRVQFPNPEGRLKPGRPVTIVIEP